MKTISLALIAILLIGTFAFPFVLSQEEANSVDDIIDSEDLQNDINDVLEESDYDTIGVKTSTLAEGWAINSVINDAELVKAFWVSRSALNVDAQQIKDIKEKYKGDKKKIQEELKKVSSGTVEFSLGKIMVGLGSDKEKFKLVEKSSSDNSIIFYVLPVNSQYAVDSSANSVGTLELEKKNYPSLDLWTGTLVLNSGEHSGSWAISLASKTKVYVGQQKKPKTLWNRLFGWGNSNNDDAVSNGKAYREVPKEKLNRDSTSNSPKPRDTD